MIRAAGVPWDIRKDEPYSGYEKFDFRCRRAPRTTCGPGTGSACEEMRAERQNREAGSRGHAGRPVAADIPRVVLPEREKMKTQMEALIYHFKIVTEGMRVPAGEVYQADRIAARRDRLLRGQRRVTRIRTACSCERRASATCRRCRRWSKAN